MVPCGPAAKVGCSDTIWILAEPGSVTQQHMVEAMSKTYAIADLHGRYDLLEMALLGSRTMLIYLARLSHSATMWIAGPTAGTKCGAPSTPIVSRQPPGLRLPL